MPLDLSFITSYITSNIITDQILYYIALYSALPTINNDNKSNVSIFSNITPKINQQYPEFIMTKFSEYTKVIILLDEDFEINLEILKYRHIKPDVYIEHNYIKFYKYNNEYIFIIEYSITDSEILIINNFLEYFIYNSINFNNKLIIHSFFDPLNLFVNFYNYLIKINKNKDLTIHNNIIVNFTPIRNYLHGNCFCNGHDRFPINNTLFNISDDNNFIQYKLIPLNKFLEIIKYDKNLRYLIYYYIIHILESLNTVIKYNYKDINDCLINNDEYTLYFFIAYDISILNKSMILDIVYMEIKNTLLYLLSEHDIKQFLLWKNDSDKYYLANNLIFKSFYDIQGIILSKDIMYSEKLEIMLSNLFDAIKNNDPNSVQGFSNFKANLTAFFRLHYIHLN